MTHLVRLAIVVCLLTACGDSNGPGSFHNADFVGTWQVNIPATAACWNAFTIQFVVSPQDAAATEGQGVLNMVSTWWLTSDPSSTSLFSGHFSTEDFAFVFNFAGSTSLRMDGRAGTSKRVTGIFQDRDGIVSPAGCSANAFATHQ